jgi:hypothetical protein
MIGRIPSHLRNRVFCRLVTGLVLVCFTSGIVGCSSTEPAEIELARMFAYLPPLLEQSNTDGVAISFSNLAELKRWHKFPEDITFDDVPVSMMDDFLEAVESAGMCPSLGAHIQAGHTQMDIGYDLMVVQRCIQEGDVTFLETDFDREHVAVSLQNLGYGVDRYEGVTTYHYDAGSYTGEKIGRQLAERVGHVAVLKGLVVTAATSERLHAALDAWAKRTDNLSNTPQYAVLAHALGPAVSARFLFKGDRLVGMGYGQVTITEKESLFSRVYWPVPSRDTPPNWWQDIGTSVQERTIVFASTHTSTEEARAEGIRLFENLEAHALVHQYREIGAPTIMVLEDEVVLTVAIALKDKTPGGIPEEMASVWP